MNSHTPNASHPMVQQTTNNTTGWVGHHPREHKEISRGQTFVASAEADINAIEVYSNFVSQPGNVMMTIHSFDPQQNSWGPALGSASVDLKKSDSEKWIAFKIPSLHLDKGKSYGFRLESHDSYLGVGEAAGSAKQPPFSAGQEWKFINNDKHGDAYSYFSLAFKVRA